KSRSARLVARRLHDGLRCDVCGRRLGWTAAISTTCPGADCVVSAVAGFGTAVSPAVAAARGRRLGTLSTGCATRWRRPAVPTRGHAPQPQPASASEVVARIIHCLGRELESHCARLLGGLLCRELDPRAGAGTGWRRCIPEVDPRTVDKRAAGHRGE